MPVLENIDTMTVNTPVPPPAETETVREITQTDHLNKRLLKSLLDSMKVATETPEPIKTDTNDSDFDD